MSSVKGNLAYFDVRPYVFGGTAAVIAEICTFPLDTAKIRLQLQGSAGHCTAYSSTADCLYTIARQEGVARLYRGLSPAVVRQAVYGTIKFGAYYSVKDMVTWRWDIQQESAAVNVCCGVLAGGISSAIANPTDVMKVRMQARTVGNDMNQKNMVSIGMDILRREGVGGLWRGVCPTTQRSAVVAGVQLPVYDLAKAHLLAHRVLCDGAVCHLVSSILAGITAAAASNPVDVIRTRMMIQRKLKGKGKNLKIYRSSVECGVHIVTREGPMALYKGFVPAFSRMGPWNIVFFLVYEKLKLIK